MPARTYIGLWFPASGYFICLWVVATDIKGAVVQFFESDQGGESWVTRIIVMDIGYYELCPT